MNPEFFVLALTLLLLTWLDWEYKIIPNGIIIPAIVIAILFCGQHYIWGGLILALSIFEYKYKMIAGGDVKLFTFLGLILGSPVFIVLFASNYFIRLFRRVFNYTKPLPATPFVTLATILVLIMQQPVKILRG